MARHAYNIIKCIKIMQKFPKYDSYFRTTNKGKELLLLEGAVDKKSHYTKATQIPRQSSQTRRHAAGFFYQFMTKQHNRHEKCDTELFGLYFKILERISNIEEMLLR